METIAGNVLVACDATGLLWAAVTLTLACARRRGCGSMFRSLVRDETGGSYMAGAVMVFPMKIMLIAIVVELTMLLIALGGTFYASYVTARSAVVWLSAAPQALGAERIRLAAVQAMVPLASSDARCLGPSAPGAGTGGLAYIAAYHRYSPSGPLGDLYLGNKYRYATVAVSVVIVPSAPNWNSDVTAILNFEHAVRCPILGPLVGHRAPWGGNVYTVTIPARATLRNEGPRNGGQTLGINYASE